MGLDNSRGIIQPIGAMKNTAQILPDEVKVRHTFVTDIDREFLTLDVPNGWEDVDKVRGKVLEFDGRRFVFTGWNSDRNEAFFSRPLSGGFKLQSAKWVK